jgi:hypothetical protein
MSIQSVGLWVYLNLAPPLTAIFVGWALPTMLEQLILSMVGIAHPTLVRSGARSQFS